MRRFLYRGSERFEIFRWPDDLIDLGRATPPVEQGTEEVSGAAPLTPEPDELTWARFRIVEDSTGFPLQGVKLKVLLPNGEESTRSSNDAGIIEYKAIAEGTLTAETATLEGARMSRTLHFVGTGEAEGGSGEGDTPPDYGVAVWQLATIEEHKVASGDTIASIAEANGMTWRDLANFNWGTKSPSSINEHLFDDVGCTKKTKDGKNYVFTDDDHPGIVYIPKKWEESGLATGEEHVIRVKRVNPFIVRLENDLGLRIPGVAYEAIFADDSTHESELAKNGLDLIPDPIWGPIAIIFTDHDDIRAKSVAATARRAFDDRDAQLIFKVLKNSPTLMEQVVAVYDEHYNDLSGEGLVEDIYNEITDPDALGAIVGLMLLARLEVHEDAELVEVEEGA